jgi:outer membrane protein assembly factor BamB
MKVSVLLLSLFAAFSCFAQPVWQANLDSGVRFYQTTDFGIVVAGSDNSLYALDGQTGERLWRRPTRGLDETSVTPVPATDVILVSTDEGDRSRVEAVDLLSGGTLWRSDKVKGDVMQLAVDPPNDLLAVVLVKKAKGRVGEEFKRTPIVHVFELSTGSELWKKELDSDVQMMPTRFDAESEVAFTLDNYRAPLILDGRVYLFYEGVTSYDAKTGKEGERDGFKVNEGGLALTEADPIFDDKYLYTSGKGKVRAINRQTFKTEWEAKDLGVTPEMAVVGKILYVRTGGQFTRIKDGEIEEEGAFGVSALDAANGKTLWRYKGADKGLTNFVFADANTILIADKNELITLDARTGKKIGEIRHEVEKAQFVLLNERRQAVVGGRDEIAAFEIGGTARAGTGAGAAGLQIANDRLQNEARFEIPNVKFQNIKQSVISNVKSGNSGRTEFFDPASRIIDQSPLAARGAQFSKLETRNSKLETPVVWRVKHKAPSRGVFRVVAGIALRATALYFRYGGLATSALNIARGASIARSVLSLRWSGLKNSFSSLDLTTLAANSARNYVTGQINVFGVAARSSNLLNRVSGVQVITPAGLRGKLVGGAIRGVTPSRADVQESLLDRLDPVRQVEKLSDYFLRRQRLADLRGNYMYFYTDLPKPFDRKGLVGVNVHTGQDARFILVSEPDPRFTTDEIAGLLYSAAGNRLQAFDVMER